MKKVSMISNEIDEFYSFISDDLRYDKGLGPFEFERIKSLLLRFIPTARSVVLDVGGGTGVYAEWLAMDGHEVYLIDPVKVQVKKAKRRSARSKHRFTCRTGEARNLDFPDNFADMVILHGPLYHLQCRKDRIKAIKEAKRVCKPGGMVVGLAINHASYTLIGLLSGLIHDQVFFALCKKHLRSGVHMPPRSGDSNILPEAFFHRPDELMAEFEEVRLTEVEMYAVEGMCWLDKDFFQSMQDPVRKKTLLDLLKIIEKDRSLLAFSPHMMVASRKCR